jgi:uncharacterized 2Fe-2S/4Fe-4S cluster protein (DUF4445 family)
MYRVLLEPSGQTVTLDDKTSLHEAIIQAGLSLNLPCGGQGRCGKCKVLVKSGQVRRRSTLRLSQEELEIGWALACQTLVESDCVVYVPAQEAIERKLPSDRFAAREVALSIECDLREPPLVRRYDLRIEPPSLEDNTTDLERFRRELFRQHGIKNLDVSLAVLRRLARSLREADWHVTAILETPVLAEAQVAPRLLDIRPIGNEMPVLGVSIDIGTTSNVVYLVDLEQRAVLDSASAYNGQIACGEDVISRIIYAGRDGGLDHLQKLVIGTLNQLLVEIAHRNNIDLNDVYRATVAGNTTMSHLFLGLNPAYIRLEPYIPTLNHPLPVAARELGLKINPEATVDCLPSVGAYVGGDITAGVLSSNLFRSEKLTLFIDIGTNGEIVLGNADWLISCACSAGPAFEGGGVECGMRATEGAIEEVWINVQGYEPTYHTIGDAPPRGICGSGMISLLGEMFVTGVVDKAGRVNRTLNTPRIRIGEHGPEYVVAWAAETADKSRDIVLTEVDIANLIRAKGAIYAGFSVLTRSVGLSLADVEEVLIGGAFGKYLDIEKAVQIGLLPDMPQERFRYLGNTSAQGAFVSLVCPDMRREIIQIASKMTYLELSADNTFMEEFTSALFLPHTDTTNFPSVMRLLKERGIGSESQPGS